MAAAQDRTPRDASSTSAPATITASTGWSSCLGGDHVGIPKRPGEPDCTFADTTRIRDRLGWAPQVSFEQGVAEILENIDYWRDAPVWTTESIAEATADWFTFLGKDGGS